MSLLQLICAIYVCGVASMLFINSLEELHSWKDVIEVLLAAFGIFAVAFLFRTMG